MTSPARSSRTLEDRARFGLGYDTQDDESDPSDTQTLLTVEGVIEGTAASVDLATQTELDAHINDTTNAHVLSAFGALISSLTVTSLDGNDGDPATYTFTGGAVGDVVIAVLHVSTKASVATIAVEDPADYAITADTLTGPGTDFTDDQLLVIWADLT